MAIGLALSAAAPVFAQARPGSSIRASPAEMLAIADRFEKAGQREAARRIWELLARDPNPDVRNEARFRLALLHEAAGRDRDAAVLLRRILDDRPDAAAVRIRLAVLLQKMGDDEAAHRELRSVRLTDLPPNVARFVDRLSAAAQARKRLGFQVEVALAPDSNINRASRSDTIGTTFGDFELDDEARSGIGLATRGQVQARLPLDGQSSFVARAGGEARLYRDRDFNDIVLGISGGPEIIVGRTILSAEAGASQQWYGMEPYQRTFRLTGSAVRRLDDVSQLRIDAVGRIADDQVNDLRDGDGLTLLARFERALTPQLAIIGNATVDRFKARDDAYSTWSWAIGLQLYRDVGRMNVNAGIEVGSLRSDERLQLLLEKRDDQLLRLQLGAVFRQLTVSGFAPVARIIFERNRSSVEFHDYRRLRTEFGVSRAF